MRIVIVGGGYGGVAAALRLSHRAKHRAEITLISSSEQFVERIRLHQVISGQPAAKRSLAQLLAGRRVRLIVGHASNVEPGAQTLFVNGETLEWDRLVLATGSYTPQTYEGAYSLNPGATTALHARLAALAQRKQGRVAVVGAGLTGIETATEIAERWPQLRVALVGASPPLAGWSPAARRYLDTSLTRHGIAVHSGCRVSGVTDKALLTDQHDIASDITIWTAGFGFSGMPRRAGISVNGRGQVLVDPMLRSLSHPHIYAAGDLAAPVLDPGDVLPLGCKSALPGGAHVGDNLARECTGAPLVPFDFRGVFYCVSLGRRDGLIQWTAPAAIAGQTEPTGPVMTGRAAALFKEMVCKGTWLSLAAEARGIRVPMGLRSGHAPAELPQHV